MKLELRAAMALLAASLSAPVSAATIFYTLSGAASAEFSIEQSPRPDQVYTTAFRLNFVEGYFGRQEVIFDKLLFYTSADLGGVGATFEDGAELAFSTAGEQLFTGSLTAPVMRIGTFTLSRYGPSGNVTEQYILTSRFASVGNALPLDESSGSSGGVTPPAGSVLGAVPEPSTWAMMLIGFGAVGYSMRRRSAGRRGGTEPFGERGLLPTAAPVMGSCPR